MKKKDSAARMSTPARPTVKQVKALEERIRTQKHMARRVRLNANSLSLAGEGEKRGKKMILSLISLILMFGLVGTVSANGTLYVGTGQQFDTIQEAIDAANPGDTINVAAGTYETGAVIIDKSLTLISDTGDYRTTGTILTNHSEIRLQGDVDNVTIKGFKFLDITDTTFQAAIHSSPGVGQSHDNILIESNSFTNLEKHAVKTNANNNNFIIRDNSVTNIGTAGGQWTGFQIFFLQNGQITNNIIDTTTYAGINLDTVTDSIISGNTISNIVSSGIQLANSPNSDSVISDNTITNANTGNSADKGAIAIYPNSNDVTIENNILNNNNNGFAVRDKTGAVASDVIVTNNEISGNAGFGAVNLARGGGTLDAENNYWGHATGPSGEGFGMGDAVSANVDYSPFRTDSPRSEVVVNGYIFGDDSLEVWKNQYSDGEVFALGDSVAYFGYGDFAEHNGADYVDSFEYVYLGVACVRIREQADLPSYYFDDGITSFQWTEVTGYLYVAKDTSDNIHVLHVTAYVDGGYVDYDVDAIINAGGTTLWTPAVAIAFQPVYDGEISSIDATVDDYTGCVEIVRGTAPDTVTSYSKAGVGWVKSIYDWDGGTNGYALTPPPEPPPPSSGGGGGGGGGCFISTARE